MSTVKKSQARRVAAWARRNSPQVGPVLAWRRLDAVALQDGPDARRSEPDAHADQLAMDPPVAPGGVLPGQADHEADGADWDRRSPWPMGIGPAPTHQVPMPAQQRLGLDEESATSGTGEQSSSGPRAGPDRLVEAPAGSPADARQPPRGGGR